MKHQRRITCRFSMHTNQDDAVSYRNSTCQKRIESTFPEAIIDVKVRHPAISFPEACKQTKTVQLATQKLNLTRKKSTHNLFAVV